MALRYGELILKKSVVLLASDLADKMRVGCGTPPCEAQIHVKDLLNRFG